MVRRFWRAMIGLWGLGVLFTFLSWLYLYLDHVPQNTATSAANLLTLPTGFPSIWLLLSPAHGVTSGAIAVILIFQVVQVALTGGLYGTLARVNTGQSVSASSFAVDSGRAFPRLFIWSLLWFIVQSIVVTQGAGSSASASASLSVSVVMLLLRFLFVFAEAALVCEQQASFYATLGNAMRTLTQNVWRVVPVAAALAIVTGIATASADRFGGFASLAISLLYSIVGIWLLHMVMSRYLVFSGWQSRVE